jgi:predicted acylesterase/phospholipase RssA
MATKNSLFSLASKLAPFLLVAACQTQPTQQQPYPVHVEPGQPVPIQQVQPPEQGVPQTLPPPQTSAPRGNVLPVGVFLSAGAIRSFAHVGVLRAFQRAQIPVVAIGGME